MSDQWPGLDEFLQVLGLEEEPLGLYYTGVQPETGLTPDPLDPISRAKEIKGEINWGAVFGGFSCVMGHIWRARRKRAAAWFSADHYGCPGGAFYLGFMKPQTELIVHYVSTGLPGQMEGECYLPSPDKCRAFFEYLDPRPAPKPFMVVKPLGLFQKDEKPELVVFFCRPESLAGLHQLAAFVTGEAEVVRSPFGAGCSNITSWPFFYLSRGRQAAVLGGWDPSARQFYKTDELSFTVPLTLFEAMLAQWPASFLTRKAWRTSRQKIARSRRAWGEGEA
ncbi:MAG: DUF169 domain-containing protein [Thermodesulfobacteriota bacterium]